MRRHGWTALASAALSAVSLAAAAAIEVPFVAVAPGETLDLLSGGDRPVVRVANQDTFPTSGRLLLTAVQQTPPDGHLSILGALRAYWSHDQEVLPRGAVYAPGSSAQSVRVDEAAQVSRSQSDAVAAALKAAGIRVDPVAVVKAVNASGPSADVLQPGDILLAVRSAQAKTPMVVRSVEEANAAITMVKPGTELVLTLQRLENQMDVVVHTEPSKTSPTASVAGLTLAQGYLTKPDVAFALPDDSAGDTAGLMFALAVYDQVTADPLLRDRVVAGAGTITAAGEVGRVPSIRERIGAAERGGASVFLVPGANCADLGDAKPTVRLVRVDTLTEAIRAVEALSDPTRDASVKGC